MLSRRPSASPAAPLLHTTVAMSQPPQTPVKVPASATNYTPATLDPDLRSNINAMLIRDGHVQKISDALLHSLHAHPSNWPTTIRTHALSLLRSGEVKSYPELLSRVLSDVRSDAEALTTSTTTATGSTSTSFTSNSKPASASNGRANGANGANGKANGAGGRATLGLPKAVVEEALRTTKESLEQVCEVDENGTI